MKLLVKIPQGYEPERRYVLDVLLEEFLGLDFDVLPYDDRVVRIIGGDGKECQIVDRLFSYAAVDWLTPRSLPAAPLQWWDSSALPFSPKLVNPMVPVIYGDDPKSPDFFKCSPTSLYLGIDVFGAAFFMLSQYEEIVKPDRDGHDRFPGAASLACQEGFLDRPIIDEYVEILWECLRYLWPELRRRERSFRMVLSHDVDWPFEHAFMGALRMVRRCAGDLVRRRDLTGPLRRLWGWSMVKLGNAAADPCNNFASLMDWDEHHGVRSAFYFIAAHTAGGEVDGLYQLGHPWIRSLMCEIHQRGHEIGLHPSYNTYCDPVQTRREFEMLRHQCEAEGIRQAVWGGRQHYLRWKVPITLQNWNDAGLTYDSSLTFADRAGFRCGVCREFPGFNVVTRHRLHVRERPLVVMECSVSDREYMGLGFGVEAFEAMAKLKACCKMLAGDFTLLWHNSRLLLPEEIQLYKEVLAC
jgi:hypothetical protein